MKNKLTDKQVQPLSSKGAPLASQMQQHSSLLASKYGKSSKKMAKGK
jgi:hypothetical protein